MFYLYVYNQFILTYVLIQSHLSRAVSYLLNGTLGLEEDASPQQLSEDAAYRPDIDGVGIVAAPHEDLRSSVVLCHHFLSHVPCLI